MQIKVITYKNYNTDIYDYIEKMLKTEKQI